MSCGTTQAAPEAPSREAHARPIEKLIEYRSAHYAAYSEASTYLTNTPATVGFKFANPIVCELKSGRKVMRVDQSPPFEFLVGDALFVPAGAEIHVDLTAASASAPIECDCVEIETRRVDDILARLNERSVRQSRGSTVGVNWSAFAVLRGEEARSLDLPSLMALFRGPRDVFTDLRIDARIEDTLLRLLQVKAKDLLVVNSPGSDTGLHAAARVIRDGLDRHVPIDELARAACMSVSSLHRNFQRQFGTTPARFANELRIAKAKRILREGEERTETLAFRLGFSDASHFSRVFRKMTGESPLEYRRRRHQPPYAGDW